MRLLFAGSPGIAVPSLEALVRQQIAGGSHEVVGVLTKADAAKGRSGRLEPSEVGSAAASLNAALAAAGRPEMALLKPETLDADLRAAVSALRPDLLVTVAYGKIFGPKFLALFPKGGINLHPSALPRWRGAAPIPAAILHRDSETALSVQRIALAMDSGDILAQERLSLDDTETTASLTALAAARGAGLVLHTIDLIASGRDAGIAQDESLATFCSMLKKEDGLIDWKLGARDIDARIRAFTPWPLSFTAHRGQKLYILAARPYAGNRFSAATAAHGSLVAAPGTVEAAPGTVVGIDKGAGILVQTGDGLLQLMSLQYESKKALDWRSFLNGARDFIGSTLGSPEGGTTGGCS